MKLIIVLAIVAVAALLWSASEQHYQSCVSAAEATTAAPTRETSANPFNAFGGSGEASGAERSAAVAACSRLP